MKHKYTKELLEPIIQTSTTWAEVCRKLEIKPFTGAQSHVRKRADDFEINYDHFTGQGWSRGKTFSKKDIELYLVENSTAKSHTLRVRLISSGMKSASCEKCGLTEWLGEPIPLELDHINSDHWDNRLENLQILCPNCHASITKARKQASVA